MASNVKATPPLGGGQGGGLCLIAALLLLGCAKDENSPDMGAVAPKPNLSAAANAPGGAPAAQPGADAAAMGPSAASRKGK